MPAYTPLLISSFKTGYYRAHEPRLAPKDAFPVLLDAHIQRGVLTKRSGFTELADTGQGDAIVGIHPYFRRGHPTYLVADTDRLWSYQPYDETLTQVTSGDTFTGGDQDLFWFQDWKNVCYLCNGVDSIYAYDEYAGTLAALDTQGDTDTDITIDSAQMIFVYRGRLCFFNCVIEGRWYPDRVYYSDVNTTNVQSTNYDSIVASDTFVGGCYVNGIPTVFGHEGTIAYLRYTGSADTPFEFKQQDKSHGIIGPRNVPFRDRAALAVGHKGLLSWDGYQTREFAPQLRRWIEDTSNKYLRSMVAALRTDRPVLYIAYPNDDATANDRLLEYDFEEQAVSLHSISATSLLGTTGHIVPTPDYLTDELGAPDSGVTLHDLDVVRHPTYEGMVLMGDSSGKLYVMNYGTTDDGTDVEADVYTARFNPFESKGLQARLGKVRFLVSTSSTETATISFYKNQYSTPWKQVTLSAAGSGDKHWVTLYGDGEVANFHRLRIQGDIPDIHAIELEFASAGELDNSGDGSVLTLDEVNDSLVTWRFVVNDSGQLEKQKYEDGSWTAIEVTDS